MGVFKNDVGRPTNETIKKRRILKAILALLVAGALFTGGYYVNEFINKYDVNKEEKENSISSKIILKETLDEEASAEFTYNNKTYNLNIKTGEDNVSVLLNEKSIYEVFAPVGLGNIYLLDDLLVIHVYSGDVRGQGLVFIDFEGNVVKEIGNVIEGNLVLNIGTRDDNISIKNDTITLNMTATTHGDTLVYKDNNDIEGSMPYSETVKSKYNINDDTIIDATYEFKYLGNKKFSVMKIVDKKTYKEYVESQGLVYEELDINSEEVMDLYIPFSYFMHEASDEELYKKDKVTQADLSVEYKNRLAFANLYNSVGYDNLFTDKIEISKEDGLYVSGFKSEVLEKYYKELFGKNAKYVAKTFDSYSINTLYMYYDEKTDTYSEDLAGGDWTPFRYGNELYKAIKKDNKIELYLYVVVFNSDYEYNRGGVYKNLEDATNLKNAIKEVKTYDELGSLMKYKHKQISHQGVYLDDLGDYKEEASQYKITFVKEDDNYIFEKIEKIK